MSFDPAIDTFSRFNRGVFSDLDLIPSPTAGQSMFGNPATLGMTDFNPNQEISEIEILKGQRTVSALIPRGAIGTYIDQPVQQDNISTIEARSFPLGSKEDAITVARTLKRIPGEPVFGPPMTGEGRLRALAARKNKELIRQHIYLMELLAWLSILEGKMPAILGTTDPRYIFDFYREPDNTIPVGTAWNDTSPTIIANLDEGCDQVEDGNGDPDMAIFGKDVWGPFLDDTTVQKRFDNRRFEQGRIVLNTEIPAQFQRFIGPGRLTPRGVLKTDNGRELWLFGYNQNYAHPITGDKTYFMPPDKVVVRWSGARQDRMFGPPEVFKPTSLDIQWMLERFGFTSDTLPMPANTPADSVIMSEMFHFIAQEKDRSSIDLKVQIAPVFIPTHVDATAVLTNVIT